MPVLSLQFSEHSTLQEFADCSTWLQLCGQFMVMCWSAAVTICSCDWITGTIHSFDKKQCSCMALIILCSVITMTNGHTPHILNVLSHAYHCQYYLPKQFSQFNFHSSEPRQFSSISCMFKFVGLGMDPCWFWKGHIRASKGHSALWKGCRVWRELWYQCVVLAICI